MWINTSAPKYSIIIDGSCCSKPFKWIAKRAKSFWWCHTWWWSLSSLFAYLYHWWHPVWSYVLPGWGGYQRIRLKDPRRSGRPHKSYMILSVIRHGDLHLVSVHPHLIFHRMIHKGGVFIFRFHWIIQMNLFGTLFLLLNALDCVLSKKG